MKKISVGLFVSVLLMTGSSFHHLSYATDKEKEVAKEPILSENQIRALAKEYIEKLLKENPNRLEGLNDQDSLFNVAQVRMLVEGKYVFIGLEKVPSEIGNFTNLTSLILSDGKYLELPAELANLINLKKLSIGSSHNYSTSSKSTYASAEQMTKMTEIIAKLKNLQDLGIMNSRLEIFSPDLWNLDQLKELKLFSNDFVSIPADIGKLESLNELHIWWNKFLTTIPKEIGNLKNLDQLVLNANALTTIPKEIGNLENVTSLVLASNPLTSIPKEIGKLTKLRKLNLRDTTLISLPKEIGNLNNIQLLNLNMSPILPRGENENMWGREELIARFGDRVVFETKMEKMSSSTTLEDVQSALAKQPLQISWEALKSAKLPEIPTETIEDGKEFDEKFMTLISRLNFSDEEKEGYLSYELLAGDYASEARDDVGSNTDKIFKYILPRLTGYFHELYNISLQEGEEGGWPMYDENKPALKKALSYIVETLNNTQDPGVLSGLFLLLVDGMLHCPTGQKEGIDTVVLSLMGQKLISSDLRPMAQTIIALKKQLHFKTAILAKGANSSQNVHLISTYEDQLRDILGFSNILQYKEQMGIFGTDPFSGNANNVLKVYFDLLPPARMIDWIMEKVQTPEDRQVREQLTQARDQLTSLRKRLGKTGSSSSSEEEKQDAPKNPLKIRLEKLKSQLSDSEVPQGDSKKLESQIAQLEKIFSRQQESNGQETAQNLSSNEIESLKQEINLQVKKVQELEGANRMRSQFRPITLQVILTFLSDTKRTGGAEDWWKTYFTADPLIDSQAALTSEGARQLLLDLGYLIQKEEK